MNELVYLHALSARSGGRNFRRKIQQDSHEVVLGRTSTYQHGICKYQKLSRQRIMAMATLSDESDLDAQQYLAGHSGYSLPLAHRMPLRLVTVPFLRRRTCVSWFLLLLRLPFLALVVGDLGFFSYLLHIVKGLSLRYNRWMLFLTPSSLI